MSPDEIKELRRRAAAAMASQQSRITRSFNPMLVCARAKLKLKNESDYQVSYWVVNDDLLPSDAVKRRVFRNIEDHLNNNNGVLTTALNSRASTSSTTGIGISSVSSSRNVAQSLMLINAEDALDEEYCVLRDERLQRSRAAVRVSFPKGCRKLRVYCYAWFEKEKEWRVIRDKVCENGRRRKTFTLSSTNETVALFEL